MKESRLISVRSALGFIITTSVLGYVEISDNEDYVLEHNNKPA